MAPLYHRINFMIWRNIAPEYATPSTLCAVISVRGTYPLSKLRGRLREMDRGWDAVFTQQLKWMIQYQIMKPSPWYIRIVAKLRVWWSSRRA